MWISGVSDPNPALGTKHSTIHLEAAPTLAVLTSSPSHARLVS